MFIRSNDGFYWEHFSFPGRVILQGHCNRISIFPSPRLPSTHLLSPPVPSHSWDYIVLCSIITALYCTALHCIVNWMALHSREPLTTVRVQWSEWLEVYCTMRYFSTLIIWNFWIRLKHLKQVSFDCIGGSQFTLICALTRVRQSAFIFPVIFNENKQ